MTTWEPDTEEIKRIERFLEHIQHYKFSFLFDVMWFSFIKQFPEYINSKDDIYHLLAHQSNVIHFRPGALNLLMTVTPLGERIIKHKGYRKAFRMESFAQWRDKKGPLLISILALIVAIIALWNK